MKVIVYLLGLTTIAMSSFFILYTRGTVNAFRTFLDSYQLRFLSIIPAIVGLLFLMSAGTVSYPWVFRIVAVFAFAETVLAIVNPDNVFGWLLNWFFGDISDRTHRLFGIIGIIFGTVMIAWIR
jgi:hypothetical protein